MWKIKFVAEEFFRSFQKSLFKNILIMIMFSIGMVMAVLMCSYYFDVGDRYSDMTQHVGDSEWYNLELLSDGTEITDSFSTVTGCRNMMDYYEELSSLEDYPSFSLNTQQSVYVREQDIENLFNGKSYLNFLDEKQNEPVKAQFGETEICFQQCLQSAQVDLNGYRMFGFRTEEGEGFTEKTMTIEKASDPIPILLGNDYKGMVKVGDVIDVGFWYYIYPCKVIGILEQGAALPENGQLNVGMIQMDSKILFPYGISVQKNPEDVGEIMRYAFLDYMTLEFAVVQAEEGENINELVEVFRNIGEKYQLPVPRIVGTSMGMNLLRKESSASVRIMLILTVALLGFSFYGLFVTFYDKIQSNSRIYGIYLMNGCSLGMIVVSCLLEIAVILLPSVFVGKFIFTVENMGVYRMDAVLRMVYMFTGVAFFAGALFLTYLMRGVDTEHLIRRKD